jgi:hypothetical protein
VTWRLENTGRLSRHWGVGEQPMLGTNAGSEAETLNQSTNFPFGARSDYVRPMAALPMARIL